VSCLFELNSDIPFADRHNPRARIGCEPHSVIGGALIQKNPLSDAEIANLHFNLRLLRLTDTAIFSRLLYRIRGGDKESLRPALSVPAWDFEHLPIFTIDPASVFGGDPRAENVAEGWCFRH
jgi:hypothetical protein